MTETQWDRLLKIRTTGRDDSNSNRYNYPYEPTPYEVLEWLAVLVWFAGYLSFITWNLILVFIITHAVYVLIRMLLTSSNSY